MRTALAWAALVAGLTVPGGCGGGEASGDHFTEANWPLLAAHPDAYPGASVDVVCKLQRTTASGAHLMVCGAGRRADAVVTGASAVKGIGPGDYVRLRGTVEPVEGAGPVRVDADRLTKVSALAAAPPPSVRLARQDASRFGIRLSVLTVALGEEETRVTVEIENRSAYALTVFADDAVFRSGSRATPPTETQEYPQLAPSLEPADRTRGIIRFPPHSVGAHRYELRLEILSEDSNLGDFGTIGWSFVWGDAPGR